MNNNYTSFELMKMFDINRGSWSSIKEKLNLNSYAIKTISGKTTKYLYNEKAVEELKQYYKSNSKDIKILEDNKSLVVIQMQEKQIQEYKKLLETFKNYYEEEKEKTEDLLICNANIKNDLENYKIDNNNLNLKNDLLVEEIEKLKHRNIIKRLFNID